MNCPLFYKLSNGYDIFDDLFTKTFNINNLFFNTKLGRGRFYHITYFFKFFSRVFFLFLSFAGQDGSNPA